jgi:SsrA-binding protein
MLTLNKNPAMVISTNKKAYFDYEVLEKFEAGLVLSGREVKSVRSGLINLKGAYITFHNNEAYLINAHITLYTHSVPDDAYNPTASRKLLLKRKELSHLQEKSQEKGLTIIPLTVYSNHHRIKLEVGLCRGKHTYNKKETIKKRDIEREKRKTLNQQ